MKLIHDDGGNDVDDGDVGRDANHDVGYDVIDDVKIMLMMMFAMVLGEGGGCHP
jgi:hypothetical protein